MAEERYCTNCRALIPRGSGVCPECGTYAGDVFDGKLPKAKRSSNSTFWIILLAAAVAAGGYWFFSRRVALPRPDTGPVRVVGDRPGGEKQRAEAAMSLRHYFAGQPQPIKSQCLAIINRGYSNGYYNFDAVNSCDRTRLGRWKVDARTKAVSR